MSGAGDRDECVRIFRKDCEDTDDYGVPIETEVTVIPIYHAKVVSRSVKEKVSSDADTWRERHVLLGLWDRNITEHMFAEWEGRIYDVENVFHKRSRDETHITISNASDRNAG